jgi:hypothetical protein
MKGDLIMKKYKLAVMAFDGDIQIERPEFNTIAETWDYSNDMGSKWYFYPFHFVVTASGKTIKESPELLEHLTGLRTKTVRKHFKKISELPELANVGIEEFMLSL